MNTTRINTSLAFVILLLTACAAPPKVRVDKDTSTNFASYKTFSWLGVRNAPPAATAAPGHPITPEGNSIAENRVRNAVIEVLQAKGYLLLTNGNPDFRVSYALNVYEKHKESGMRIGLGAGGGGGNMSGGVGMSVPVGKSTEMMGTMTIDVIDAARNAQVWTGSYEQKIPKDALTDESAKQIVSTILARFPTDSSKK